MRPQLAGKRCVMQTAVGFYEKAGYTCQGEAFLEVGIPHRYMEKHWG